MANELWGVIYNKSWDSSKDLVKKGFPTKIGLIVDSNSNTYTLRGYDEGIDSYWIVEFGQCVKEVVDKRLVSVYTDPRKAIKDLVTIQRFSETRALSDLKKKFPKTLENLSIQ